MDAQHFRDLLRQVPSWNELEAYIVSRHNDLVQNLIYRSSLTEPEMREIIGELRGLALILHTPDYFENQKRQERELEEEADEFSD